MTFAAMMAGLLMVAQTVLALPAGGAAKDVPLKLDGLTRQVVEWSDHGKARSCEGVWLRDVLAQAGAPAGESLRGEALLTVVMAEAVDGYRAVFSLGELDAKLGAARVLVTARCDGMALDAAQGPFRLVAPGDQRGARSVRQLVRLTLLQAGR